MGHKIVVSSNCQTASLSAALAAMLPADTLVPRAWIGSDASKQVLRDELRDADVWVTVAGVADGNALLPEAGSVTVVRVPRVLFGAFHPDTIYMADPRGNWLASPVARMHSAIVVWGWRHGLAAQEIIDRFAPATMDDLGYTSDWDNAVALLRGAVEDTDIDFPSFFLPLRQGLPFMLSVNHPRIRVLIQIARQVSRRLGADPDLVEFPWEGVLVDPLHAYGPAWPVYPPVAEALSVRGGYVWRRQDGSFCGLETFVAESLDLYSTYHRSDVVVPALDDPRFDAVLGGTRTTV